MVVFSKYTLQPEVYLENVELPRLIVFSLNGPLTSKYVGKYRYIDIFLPLSFQLNMHSFLANNEQWRRAIVPCLGLD